MEAFKKILGIVWIALALVVAYFCIVEFGIPKITSGSQDDLVFGIIILFVLTPIISLGMALFGYYALQGEYSDDKM
jgi:small-conductance mechanosensitive channel